MNFYVYVIQSELDGSYYKGFTTDPVKRLQSHNEGESFYTRQKRPWRLVYLEIHTQKREALIREKVLKKYSHQQFQQLILSSKNQLNNLPK